MWRTRVAPVLTLAALLSCAVARGDVPQHVSRIDGIGMLDYTHGHADYKVGRWVKYHVTAKSDMGVRDDYTVTVLIAGTENWWGEDCFWVETWTAVAGEPPTATATLMSYAVFDDVKPVQRMQLYMRKTISGAGRNGEPTELIYRRPSSTLKSRTPVNDRVAWNVDTLDVATIPTAKGPLACRKVRIEQGVGTTAQSTDSTEYTELRETRLTFMSPGVPLTRIAREDIDTGYTRKTWAIGHSKEAIGPFVLDRSHGTAELVDFGDHETARIVPESRRHDLSPSRAAPVARRSRG